MIKSDNRQIENYEYLDNFYFAGTRKSEDGTQSVVYNWVC